MARTVPSWESTRPAQLVLTQLLEPLNQDGRETVRWEAAASQLLLHTLITHGGCVQSGIHGGTDRTSYTAKQGPTPERKPNQKSPQSNEIRLGELPEFRSCRVGLEELGFPGGWDSYLELG